MSVPRDRSEGGYGLVEEDEIADLDPTAFAGIDWRSRSGGGTRGRRSPVQGGATVT